MTDSSSKPSLQNQKQDLVASALRVVANSIPIPIIGPLLSEIITNVIPHQRTDRFAEYIKILEERFQSINIDAKRIREKFTDPEIIDLLEECIYRAARATSEARLKYVANLLTDGVLAEASETLHHKYILGILNELNDAEVLLLEAYNRNWDKSFVEQHGEILRPPIPTNDSSREELDQRIVFDSYDAHLDRLQLIKPRLKKSHGNAVIDPKTGQAEITMHEITRLGRLLLRYISGYTNDG